MRVRGLNLRFLALWILFLCLFQSPVARAENLLVPADFPSIQAALDASKPSDTIIVSPGTYSEVLRLPGHDLILTSIDPTSTTIVAGTLVRQTNAHRGFPALECAGTETSATLIQGLTFSGRDRAFFDTRHSGVLGNGSRATLRNCTFQLYSGGSGVRDFGGLIEDCAIVDCVSTHGGGAFNVSGEIKGTLFSGCTAGPYPSLPPFNVYWGGAIAESSADVYNCRFLGSRASTLGEDVDCVGGALAYVSGNVTQCYFEGCISRAGGAGDVAYELSGEFSGNVCYKNGEKSNFRWEFAYVRGFTNNVVCYSEGGGIVGNDGATPIAGNVFYGNLGARFTNLQGQITNNIVWGPGFADSEGTTLPLWHYSILPPPKDIPNYGIPSGDGVLRSDPQFILDERGIPIGLSSSSPAIDSGQFLDFMLFDASGLPRPIQSVEWEPRGDGSGFDIGPFEYQESIPLPTTWLLRGAAAPRAGTSEGPQSSAPAVEQLMKRLVSPYDQREFVEVPVLIPAPSK